MKLQVAEKDKLNRELQQQVSNQKSHLSQAQVDDLQESNTQLVIQRKALSKKTESLQSSLQQSVQQLADMEIAHGKCSQELKKAQSTYHKEVQLLKTQH